MLYSEVLGSVKEHEGGGWTATVSEDWLQGRSIFGGLQAALALRAMRFVAPGGVPLRSLQITFLAPVPAGSLHLQARVLRAGKSATHVEAQLTDGQQTLCTAIGIFGAARPSVVQITPAQPVVTCDKPIIFPYIPGLTPSFIQHFAVRWLRGGLPFTGSKEPRNVLEIDLRDAGSSFATEEHVLGIADFIPPIALSFLKKPSVGSSMTWMIEFLSERIGDLPLQGWRMDAELVAAHDGYTSQSGLLWGPDGSPVALSRQNMVVFA
jgi:acyl-CoA thioesterase